MAVPESRAAGAPSRLRPSLKLVKGGEDSQVSSRVRVFALVGVLAVLGLAGAFMTMGRTQEVSLAAGDITPLPKRAPVAKGAAVPPLKATPAAAAPKAAPTPAAAPVAQPAPKPVAKPKPESVLGASIDAALAKNRVVVVSLYSNGAAVADMARQEALAGAGLAGAGFVALDVLKHDVAPISALLGVTSDPSLIVLKRPNNVVVRIDGFADRETVAQAVANASLAS